MTFQAPIGYRYNFAACSHFRLNQERKWTQHQAAKSLSKRSKLVGNLNTPVSPDMKTAREKQTN
jgi:hypothetical protein